jgi:hypothetical protein
LQANQEEDFSIHSAVWASHGFWGPQQACSA